MKIIYLHQYFTSPDMSGGTRSYEMAKRLVAKGHDVHIVTTCREPTQNIGWFETDCDGIKVHWLPLPYANQMSFLKRLSAFFRFAIQASVKAASIKADIIFATSTPLTIAIPAVAASRWQKIPMVFEVRDLWPETPIAMGVLRNSVLCRLAYLLEKWAYRNSDAIVALSPGMRDGVVDCGYPGHKVAVIPNSSDNELFTVPAEMGAYFREQRYWLGNRPLLVYAGTFGHVNGAAYLVRIAQKLLINAPEVRVLMIGGGIELNSVKKLAIDLGVYEKNIFFEESIPKNKMPELMSAADMSTSLVIDIPELHKNSANKFFDTLAASRPVLINHGGWMADLINMHKCGLVTYGLSIDEAACQITAHLTNKSVLLEMGANAKTLACRQFDRDILAEQLDAVLQAAVKKSDISFSAITDKFYCS